MLSTNTAPQSLTLKLAHVFHAPRWKVFEAWTTPSSLTQWFGPKGVMTEEARVEMKVGGIIQFTMRDPEGNVVVIGGEIREVEPPKRFSFTWNLSPDGCSGSDGFSTETVVTLEFFEEDNSTRLELTHDFLPSQKSRDEHSAGWSGSFECLAEII